ncbi:hypothetical protein [Epibacterium ulvae]|uniref:hypothetical protein n=1 Tax=Epibacterium ulvae TaxID=1156985 RepID=UPI002492FAF4|nr:hypothetical protein [Epibacterium ulvae]
MSKTQEYVTTVEGFTAGKWREKGETLSLTEVQAKYEHVMLKSEYDAQQEPTVELTGSLDDPLVKSSGLDEKAKLAAKTRSRTRKAS